MRNIFLLFFTVLLVDSGFAQKAMSFNGQDGRKPSARNMDKEETIKFWFHGVLPSNLAFYDECPQFYLHTDVPTKALQAIAMEQLKAIELLTGEVGTNLTLEKAEKLWQENVSTESWDASMGKLTLISLHSDLSGKTGTVTRGPYFPGEQLIIYTTPVSKTKFVLGSAVCENPTPPSAIPTNGSRGGGFEQFDSPSGTYTKVDTFNSIKGVTVINNIHVEGAQVNNSGNSTVTVPETKTTAIREWGEEESDDKPAPRGNGGGWSGGDDYYYARKQPVSINIGADPYSGAYFGVSSSRFNLNLNSGAWRNWRPQQYYGNNWSSCNYNYNYNTCRPTYHPPGPSPGPTPTPGQFHPVTGPGIQGGTTGGGTTFNPQTGYGFH